MPSEAAVGFPEEDTGSRRPGHLPGVGLELGPTSVPVRLPRTLSYEVLGSAGESSCGERPVEYLPSQGA